MGTERFRLTTVLCVAAWMFASAVANTESTAVLRGSEQHATSQLVEGNFTDTLAPHGANETFEALAMLRQLLIHQLSVPDWQWVVSLITSGLGVFMLCSPDGAFKTGVVMVVFFVAYSLTLGNLHDYYDVEHGGSSASFSNGATVWEVIMSIEVAICVSVIAWIGFRGIEMVIGMTIGLWPMRFLQTNLTDVGILGVSPWWNVIIIAACASLGVYLNTNEGSLLKRLIGYLLPVFGGRLVSSSVGWLVWALLADQNGWIDQAWLNFWKSLPLDIYDPSEQDVREAAGGAPWIGWSSPQDFCSNWVGWAIGSVIWMAFSAVAVWRHHRRVTDEPKRKLAKSQPEASPVSVRPSLLKKLLS